MTDSTIAGQTGDGGVSFTIPTGEYLVMLAVAAFLGFAGVVHI